MLRPESLPALHAAIARLAEPVDGWLLFDFRGINPIMATGGGIVDGGARDAALELLRTRLQVGEPVAGAEADRAARAVIAAAGHADRIVCRTGHSIDRVGLHGYGPTIDDTESFDLRLVLPGVGFSVEPGIYVPGEIGLRSEVNCHARADGLDVTPGDYQRDLVVV